MARTIKNVDMSESDARLMADELRKLRCWLSGVQFASSRGSGNTHTVHIPCEMLLGRIVDHFDKLGGRNR